MKIAIFGTTSYQHKMKEHKANLEKDGHNVRMPVFDSTIGPEFPNEELEIFTRNRNNLEWADQCHFFWDCRSMGTIMDFGMTFALRKPFKLIYLEHKTFMNGMKQYEEYCQKKSYQDIKGNQKESS
jgi:hypothetical protein